MLNIFHYLFAVSIQLSLMILLLFPLPKRQALPLFFLVILHDMLLLQYHQLVLQKYLIEKTS